MESPLVTYFLSAKSGLPALGLILFLSTATGHADDNSNLPSRQATVVLPILSHFSPTDSAKGSVMHELNKILGKFDRSDEEGPDDHAWRIYSYRLDDGSVIIVEFKEHSGPDSLNLTMITEQKPDGELKVLYGTAKDFSRTGVNTP